MLDVDNNNDEADVDADADDDDDNDDINDAACFWYNPKHARKTVSDSTKKPEKRQATPIVAPCPARIERRITIK